MVFSLFIVAVIYSTNLGQTKIYSDINLYGLPWFFLSILILIVWHDTYFYWAHRFFHNIHVFKFIHHIHHRSSSPTPFTSNSFDPVEAMFEILSIVIAIYTIPLHPLSLLAWDVFQFGYSIYGHLGYELLPSGFTRHWLFKWFNTATHHSMHHTHFKTNFGLYFNLWDTWMGTNHPDYHDTFETIHQRSIDYTI
jgi:sterol desaturase/sphingolipid hydroxylase (fatty acid hydroxylase superfamily)